MNQENEWQVSNLELSKKLNELGVTQKSLFYWESYEDEEKVTKFHIVTIPLDDRPHMGKITRYAAFTVGELGKILPIAIIVDGIDRRQRTSRLADKWTVAYDDSQNGYWLMQTATTEADARAKMLIYLLEQKIKTL